MSGCWPVAAEIMNLDIITKSIALDSSTIVAVNHGDSTIHIIGGIKLQVGPETIDEILTELQSRRNAQ